MGAFAIYNDCNMDSTIISNLFIDEYMKDAGEVEIKVYLYLVRMMSAGLSTSISEMAELFGHSEKEIGRALLYWSRQGLLVLNRDSRNHLVSIHLCPVVPQSANDAQAASTNNAAESDRVIPIQPILKERQPGGQPDTVQNAAPANDADEDKAQLLFIVEQYIGKPLSVSEMQTIYYIMDELHFSTDLTDYLVQYCIEHGKKDFRYIQKVAMNWAEQGIQTVDAAKKASVSSSRSRRSSRGQNTRSKNSFNEFQQNTYDFEALEKALLRQ